MKDGFTYSHTCIGRLLEGMKKSAMGAWTEKIEVVETTKEDHEAHWNTPLEDIEESKPKRKTKSPKFSSLEDFFGEDDEPNDESKRPSVPTKKTSRNKTADTDKKVRARKQT
jgi:hypothetical protein